MLVLKVVFGIIVTLPILILAEFLFEKTVDDAVIGTTAKKRVPLLKRIFRRRRHKEEDDA